MDCIFCKIINKEIPAKIIAENDFAIAFLDIDPISDGHTVVIPKTHMANLSKCDKATLNGVFSLVQDVSKKLQNSKLNPWGINYLCNEGHIAGQVVMHFHVHVIPKYGKEEGFKIGLGTKNLGDINKIYDELKINPKKKL